MKRFFMVLGVAAMALAGCSQSKDAGKPAIVSLQQSFSHLSLTLMQMMQ